MNFLERCEICAYMVKDKDVQDRVCTIDDKTCLCVQMELMFEGVDRCDCFKQAYEFEDLKDKE